MDYVRERLKRATFDSLVDLPAANARPSNLLTVSPHSDLEQASDIAFRACGCQRCRIGYPIVRRVVLHCAGQYVAVVVAAVLGLLLDPFPREVFTRSVDHDVLLLQTAHA